MIKKGLKYLVKGFIFLINLLLYVIGGNLIGLAWSIRNVLFQYYQFKKYMKWQIR